MTRRSGHKPHTGGRSDGLRPEGLHPEGLHPEGLRPEGFRPGGPSPERVSPGGTRSEGTRPKGLGPKALVEVARVARAHGIRGELCLDVRAESADIFAAGRTLFLAAPGAASGHPRPYAVTAGRGRKDRLIVALAGVCDRDAAEKLRGAAVYAAESELPPPAEDEEYLFRLLGARVRTSAGADVGVFEAVLDTPGQLTFVIRGPEGEEILFPAVPQFVRELDAAGGKIVIDPPPGLLELYRKS